MFFVPEAVPEAIVKFAINVPGPVTVTELTVMELSLTDTVVPPDRKFVPVRTTPTVAPFAPDDGLIADKVSEAESGVSFRIVFSASVT